MKETINEHITANESPVSGNSLKSRLLGGGLWKMLFWVISIIALVTIILLSTQAGISGDELCHREQAGFVCDYYKTMGKDTTALEFRPPDYNLPYYGQCADNLACAISRVFSIENEYAVRHTINSIFGWLMMLFIALIAERICGWRGAVFALLLAFFSPRLLGHSFNNLKDVPFASMMAMGLYYILRILQEFPKIKVRTAIMLALSIGLAIAVRVGGLLLIPYFAMFALLLLFFRNYREPGLRSETFLQELKRFLLYGIGISLVGYVLAVLLWPFALQKPISNVLLAYKSMSEFSISIRQLFEGALYWSDYLPWYYTPKFILITIPIAVMVGLVLFFVFCWKKKEDRFWAFFILFTFFFPVFWIVVTHANVYGGWRHAMFAYPTMVAAAAWGFDGLVRWVEGKIQNPKSKVQNSETEGRISESKGTKPVLVNVGAVALLLILLIGPIRHIVANHPYEYVYFNELVGGTKNAFGRYELDYYYHSTREASEWVLANAEKKKDGSKIIVATWHPASVNQFFRKDTDDYQVRFVRWYEKENSDWDYAIFTVTGMAPEYLRSKYFPPKNTVKTIDVNGVPIAFVLKREDKSDYQAFAMKQDTTKLDSVIMLYKKALKVDPDNMGALLNLAETYLRVEKPDSSFLFLDRYQDIDRESETGNYLRAYAYAFNNDMNMALETLHKNEKYNPKYVASYIMAIQIYLQQWNLSAAKKEFDKAIDADIVEEYLSYLWLQYCAMQNIDQPAATRELYRAMAESCEKRGKIKDAKRYREAMNK